MAAALDFNPLDQGAPDADFGFGDLEAQVLQADLSFLDLLQEDNNGNSPAEAGASPAADEEGDDAIQQLIQGMKKHAQVAQPRAPPKLPAPRRSSSGRRQGKADKAPSNPNGIAELKPKGQRKKDDPNARTGGNKGATGKCPRNATTNCLTVEEMSSFFRNKESTFFGPNAVAAGHNAGANYIFGMVLPNGKVLLQGNKGGGRALLEDERFAPLFIEKMLPSPTVVANRRMETAEDRRNYGGVLTTFNLAIASRQYPVPDLPGTHQLYIKGARTNLSNVTSKALPPDTKLNEKGKPVEGMKAYEEVTVREGYLEMHLGLPEEHTQRMKNLRTEVPQEHAKYFWRRGDAVIPTDGHFDKRVRSQEPERSALMAQLANILSESRILRAAQRQTPVTITTMLFLPYLPRCIA